MTSPFAPDPNKLEFLRTISSPRRLMEASASPVVPEPERRVTIPEIPQPTGQPQLAHRNNNPGNLRFARQEGAEPGDKGFARFPTPEEGYEALIRQVQRDQARGLPLGAFIAKYAPPSENNTSLYIQQAAAKLNVNVGTMIDQIPAEKLAAFLAHKESKSRVEQVRPEIPNPFTRR